MTRSQEENPGSQRRTLRRLSDIGGRGRLGKSVLAGRERERKRKRELPAGQTPTSPKKLKNLYPGKEGGG